MPEVTYKLKISLEPDDETVIGKSVVADAEDGVAACEIFKTVEESRDRWFGLSALQSG